MKKLVLFLMMLPLGFAFSQFNMGDAGHPIDNPADCATLSAGPSFYDDGNTGNYSSNFNDTITFCPDLSTGTKMSITFSVSGGMNYDVHESDTIYVYDGPDVNSPLIAKLNNGINTQGGSYTASWANTSGCLTVVFISDGANEAPGWLANVQCSNAPQPFEWHMEAFINGEGDNALNPLDTGSVGICLGDSVLLVATPLFPYSFEETGNGYSQHVDSTIDFEWTITDGLNYPNNDSIWFKPTTRNGFLIDLKVTDQFPQSLRDNGYVFVSLVPSFAGTGPVDDTVCLGEVTNLIGGVTPTDTVGVDIPLGTTPPPASFAGLTELPDGTGVEYSDTINLTTFELDDTISNAASLTQICLNMEHSYVGDLEIWIECPNGTEVPLFDGYNGGHFTGGNAGGSSTYLGDPIDDLNGPQGEGWTYCFSSSIFNAGTMSAENQAGNHIAISTANGNNATGNSMNPNVIYTSEGSFAGLEGCPLNGDWSVHVQDNIGNDNGYIFEWALYFDNSYFAGQGSYQNEVVHDFWSNDPAIQSQTDTTTGQTDTLLIVKPTTAGDYEFTYNVIDNFGCEYDTTVSLYVIPQPSIFSDTMACFENFNITGTESYNGGVWSVDTNFVNLSDSLADNPNVQVDTFGVYQFIYTDNSCGTSDTAYVNFVVTPYGQIGGEEEICEGSDQTLNAWHPEGWIDSYLWSTGETTQEIVINQPGTYTVDFINACGVYQDEITVTAKICDIIPPNVITLNDDGINDTWFVQSEGIKEFNCQIRNRWGNLIYEFDDPAGSWDGKTSSGQPVSEGTYFYMINAVTEGDEEIIKQGFIQVIKN